MQEDKATEIIYKTGGILGTGLKWFGSKTVDLVNNLGEYINTKIQPSQDQSVNPENKQKFEKLKETTKQTMAFTGSMLNKILSPVAKTVNQGLESKVFVVIFRCEPINRPRQQRNLEKNEVLWKSNNSSNWIGS